MALPSGHLRIRHSFSRRAIAMRGPGIRLPRRSFAKAGHSSFVICLTACLLLAGCNKATPKKPALDPNTPVEVLLPERGAYTGAFIDFGDQEDEVSLESIEQFEEMVGKHQAIIASSSYWGEQTFPTDNLNILWRHGSLPLVFWSPWDKPYVQNRGPDKFGLTEILAGKWDGYIDGWGDAAKRFGHPMIVVFGVEMNGDWFPWSGTYYGGDDWDEQANNWKGPETFRRAYRYVVDRVRARGAGNIKWMFHTNNYSYPLDTWNFAPAYYPGSDYVDWLGMSVYGQQFKEESNPDIRSLVDWPYEEMCGLDPNKPIMIAEWGTGDFPFAPDAKGLRKPEWIKQGLELFRTRYPRIKAAVYWHERWQNRDQSYSNLRVNSSVESLNAYRKGVAHPDWLGDLILRALH
ncbi:MAG TPA: glycosyl hydrolase [Chthoniobacterales bacterium]|nr:glycosyl hydrolase [Chthoniobacterales bacterium]